MGEKDDEERQRFWLGVIFSDESRFILDGHEGQSGKASNCVAVVCAEFSADIGRE